MVANQKALDDWYKQQLQSYGNLTADNRGVSNTNVGDRMMSQYYQLQNNLKNEDFGELLDFASQNVGADISGALKNQEIKRQQQAALDQWAKNQQGSFGNLTSLAGGVSNTGIGDQIGSEYARLQNAIGAQNRDYASMLGAADQGVGRSILGGAQDIMARQQQQRQLDQWAKQQQGAMSGLTDSAGGVSNTAIGDKIGSTYAQLQNAIGNPQRSADFNKQLEQSSKGIQGQIGDATKVIEQRKAAERKAEASWKDILPLAAMIFAPGIGSAIGNSLGLGSLGSAVAGGAATGGISSAITGGNIGKGMLGGAIGGGVGAGTGMLGNAMGLGQGLGGQLARGAIGGALTSGLQGGSVGRGALGGALGGGINYGVNTIGDNLGIDSKIGRTAAKGAIGGAVNAGIRGGDIGESALIGGLMSGSNAANPVLGKTAEFAIQQRQARERQQQMAQRQGSAGSREGFQQWIRQNGMSDPGTPEGRQALIQQYRNSLG